MVIKQGDYFTVFDMANELTEATDTIKKRLFRLGIKPLSRDALYSSSDFEKIKNIKIGRPSNGKKTPAKKPVKK